MVAAVSVQPELLNCLTPFTFSNDVYYNIETDGQMGTQKAQLDYLCWSMWEKLIFCTYGIESWDIEK